jgi:hypothetical protein
MPQSHYEFSLAQFSDLINQHNPYGRRSLVHTVSGFILPTGETPTAPGEIHSGNHEKRADVELTMLPLVASVIAGL